MTKACCGSKSSVAEAHDNVIRPRFGSPRADAAHNGSLDEATVSAVVVPQNPLWDIDLGAEQGIGLIRLRTEPGKTLQDFWIFVSSEPLGSLSFDAVCKDPDVWRLHVKGALRPLDDIVMDAEVSGRFVRVQAAQQTGTLPIAEVDIHLPTATDDLLQNGSDNALTVRERGWAQNKQAAARNQDQKAPRTPAMESYFQNVQTTAGAPYVLSFERVIDRATPHSDRFFVWWNGQLLRFVGHTETGYFEADVVGTGASDRILFREDRSNGGGVLMETVCLSPKGTSEIDQDAANLIDWGAFRSVPTSKPTSQGDTAVLAKGLRAVIHSDEQDAIVFRSPT